MPVKLRPKHGCVQYGVQIGLSIHLKTGTAPLAYSEYCSPSSVLTVANIVHKRPRAQSIIALLVIPKQDVDRTHDPSSNLGSLFQILLESS